MMDTEKARELAIKFCQLWEEEETTYQVFNAALSLCMTGIISRHKGKNLFEASEFLDQNKVAIMLHLSYVGWEYKDKPKKKEVYALLHEADKQKRSKDYVG